MIVKAERKTDIFDLLRVYATFLVVLSHCNYLAVADPYSGLDYMAKMNELGFVTPTASRILGDFTTLLYSFMLPLFMALSGALFSLHFKSGRYDDFGKFVANKAKRLLVPFVLVTLFYQIPLKYFSGYFANGTSYLTMIKGQLLLYGNSSLWYLPTLFSIFIIVYILEKYLPKIIFPKLIIFFAIYILEVKGLFVISHISANIIWFYFGYYLNDYRAVFEEKLTVMKAVILVGVFFFIFILYYLFSGGTQLLLSRLPMGAAALCPYIARLIKPLLAASGIVASYSVFYYLHSMGIGNSKTFKLLLRHSMGIYIYADAINYVILAIIEKYYGVSFFASNSNIVLMFVARFVLTTTAALVISIAVEKIKVLIKRKPA